jgi:acyl-CoA thioesterase I
VNAGISGDTTAGGVRRFDGAVPAGTGILVLALGANDGLRGLPIATIEENLSTMIGRARARGIRVLLCGMETLPSHGWDYTIEFHHLFQRVAAAHDVPLVPFLLAGVALNPEMNGPGRHSPECAGARRVAETVWTYLEPLVEQDSAVVAVRQGA